MLELPEAMAFSKQLRHAVLGKEVAFAEAAHSPHGFAWYDGDPKTYDLRLKGRQIDNVQPNGGQIEFYLGDMRLVLNDGVNVRYHETPDKLPAKHQLLVRFTDDSCIVCSVQMYGGMMAVKAGEYNNPYYLVGKEKPSALGPDFDKAYFLKLFEGEKETLSVKALLATEQRIPGLGNGCLQDILFNARLHPKRKIGSLSAEEKEALFDALKSTLRAMTEQGGRDTEKDIFGNPGGYRSILSSKTLAYPCMRCGGGIERKAYLGGNVYYCPHCQHVNGES